jgi:hypothetical protein
MEKCSAEKQRESREMAGKSDSWCSAWQKKNAVRFMAADLESFYAFMMLTFSTLQEKNLCIELFHRHVLLIK